MEIQKIKEKQDQLISLFLEKDKLEYHLKKVNARIKPLQEELKPYRNEEYPIINKLMFTKNMRLKKN